MGLLVAAAAALGAWSLDQPWYRIEMPQQTVVTKNLSRIQGVSASVGASAWQIVAANSSSETAAMGQELMPAPKPGTMFGAPRAAAWFAIMAGLVLLGTFAGSAFVTTLGAMLGMFAWRELVTFRNIVENPYFGGWLNKPAEGLGAFQFALNAAMFISIAAAAQAIFIAHRRRTAEREAAKAAGQPVAPTLVESLAALVQMRYTGIPQAPVSAQTKKNVAPVASATKH